MRTLVMSLLQGILIFAFAPLLLGFIKNLKCFCQNRFAPSIFQPYRDLWKLFQKQVVVPQGSSWIFRMAPYVTFASISAIALQIPIFYLPTTNQFLFGDAIVMIGLFGLNRFFLMLAGMDLGTVFGGMGASREAMVSTLSEPILLLVLLTLAMIAGSTDLSQIILHRMHEPFWMRPSTLFALCAMVLLMLAETGRIPVDNPTTHLELTMTHEAMILEYSGRYLALMEWAAQIKLMIYALILTTVFFPGAMSIHFSGYSFLLYGSWAVGKLCVFAAVLAVSEVHLAKMRLFRIPAFLGMGFVFALLALLSHAVLGVL